MWGYSGGSIATEWAAELAPTYAPELKFAGMAVGGLVPSLESALYATNGTLFAGLSAAATVGLRNAYPQYRAIVESQVVPEKLDNFDKAGTLCLSSLILEYAFEDILAYFKDNAAILRIPLIRSILNETGVMGQHGLPEMPIYAYKAVGDEISPVKDTDALIESLCARGANIQYVRDHVGEHATEQIAGAADALRFLSDRFDGVPAPVGCNVTDVAFDVLSPAAEEYFGTTASQLMSAVLGQPIGVITGLL